MGTTGYKELMDERKENYKILKHEMTKIAEKYGERVLETKNNPVSIGELKLLTYVTIHILCKHILGYLPLPPTNIYIVYEWSHCIFTKPMHLKIWQVEKRGQIS